MLGASVTLRGSKKPRSRGMGKGGSLPITTSKAGLSGPLAMSLATHSVVMPVTSSTLTPCCFSNGSISAFFMTSDHRPPYPVTTSVFCWAGACTAAPGRSRATRRISSQAMRIMGLLPFWAVGARECNMTRARAPAGGSVTEEPPDELGPVLPHHEAHAHQALAGDPARGHGKRELFRPLRIPLLRPPAEHGPDEEEQAVIPVKGPRQ